MRKKEASLKKKGYLGDLGVKDEARLQGGIKELVTLYIAKKSRISGGGDDQKKR